MWKNKPKNAKGPNLEKGESLGSLKERNLPSIPRDLSKKTPKRKKIHE